MEPIAFPLKRQKIERLSPERARGLSSRVKTLVPNAERVSNLPTVPNIERVSNLPTAPSAERVSNLPTVPNIERISNLPTLVSNAERVSTPQTPLRASRPTPIPIERTPARSIGLRAPVELDVIAHDGIAPVRCHAVELSASGIVLDRGRRLAPEELRRPLRLQIALPDLARPIAVVARTARQFGNYQALRFAIVNDVDRLTLMEYVDRAGAPAPR